MKAKVVYFVKRVLGEEINDAVSFCLIRAFKLAEIKKVTLHCYFQLDCKIPKRLCSIPVF